MSKQRMVTTEALDALKNANVPLARVEGTGPGGIVTSADVARVVEQDAHDTAVYFGLWPDPEMVEPPMTEQEWLLYTTAYPDGPKVNGS